MMFWWQDVKFAGHMLTKDGVKPDPDRVSALSNFPTPTDVTSLRSFLGLANQLAGFVPDLAHSTTKMCKLLRKKVAFNWLPEHEEEFKAVKTILTSELVIKPFDPEKEALLLTDASRLYGLGFALMQEDSDGHFKLIQCGSCSLTPTQKRYATIELEGLAIVWACKKAQYFLLGSKFKIITDHKPLLGIFSQTLEAISNPRLQRLREKVLAFNFEVEWRPGKVHIIADALSRIPNFQPDKETENYCYMVTIKTQDPALSFIFDAVDDGYRSVVKALEEDKAVTNLPPTHMAHLYSNIWGDISIIDGGDKGKLLAVNGQRIIVPPAARSHVLKLLHLRHDGIVKTRKAAQQRFFWPGISNDIGQMVKKCEACLSVLPSQPQQPMNPEFASFPMEKVGCDLYSFKGKDYIVMVDRYSGYIWTKLLHSTVTTSITKVLLNWFREFGYPEHLKSDDGPQFRTEFKEFCKKYNILHHVSSADHHQSNGLAEAGVKNAKMLLEKSHNMEQFAEALSEWRNRPRADGVSPAEMFFGRRPRSLLPSLPSSTVDLDKAAASRKDTIAKAKAKYDQHTVVLPDLVVGQHILVQDFKTKKWTIPGRVLEKRPHGRSYIVEMRGKQLRRNRRFLKPNEFERDYELSCDSNNLSFQPILKKVNFNV